MISVGTNTLYDWWRGERTIQIISHGEVVRLSPHTEDIYSGYKYKYNALNAIQIQIQIQIISHEEIVSLISHTEEIYSRSQNPRIFWNFFLTNVFEKERKIFLFVICWKFFLPMQMCLKMKEKYFFLKFIICQSHCFIFTENV